MGVDEFAIFSGSSKKTIREENYPLDLKPKDGIRHLILIVDNDANIREALQFILGKKYDLILCKSGDEAIEKVTAEVFVVILDIKMEGKNGFETFIEIKKKNLYLPIIFHSAYQDLKNPYEIINDFHPFGYVIKEGNGKELLATIESAIDYYYQINQNAALLDALEKSEKQYRDLVENSMDIIFSLDSDGRIISINQSVTRILKYSAKDIINKNFLDLAYKSNSLNSQMIQEKFQELFLTNDTIIFNCDLLTKFGEPKEMHLKLKFLPQKEGFVIFGSASNIEEDILLRLCQKESQTYEMENYLTQVELISQRLSGSAAKYCDTETSMNLKLCLREILVNAMEHGNLGISFEEKSETLENGSYVSLLIERQKEPANSEKRIIVDYSLTPEKIEVTITDEGNGFDHRKMLARKINDSHSQSLSHGRGIFMTQGFFDLIEYTEKGNSVYLVKNFK